MVKSVPTKIEIVLRCLAVFKDPKSQNILEALIQELHFWWHLWSRPRGDEKRHWMMNIWKDPPQWVSVIMKKAANGQRVLDVH